MEFSINKWRSMYDSMYREGLITGDGQLEKRIALAKAVSDYLDECGMRMQEPMWQYNADDETTHISSPNFDNSHITKAARVT